jgi:hypothetical protein
MFPLEAPMAQIGTYWFQFFRVRGGHIRRTKGGRTRPDKIPVVDNLTPGGSRFSKLVKRKTNWIQILNAAGMFF